MNDSIYSISTIDNDFLSDLEDEIKEAKRTLESLGYKDAQFAVEGYNINFYLPQ